MPFACASMGLRLGLIRISHELDVPGPFGRVTGLGHSVTMSFVHRRDRREQFVTDVLVMPGCGHSSADSERHGMEIGRLIDPSGITYSDDVSGRFAVPWSVPSPIHGHSEPLHFSTGCSINPYNLNVRALLACFIHRGKWSTGVESQHCIWLFLIPFSRRRKKVQTDETEKVVS
jgi:hypothetical protein